MSADIQTPAPAGNKSTWMSYENGILVLLGFTFGLIFFDRNAVGVLTPFILEDQTIHSAFNYRVFPLLGTFRFRRVLWLSVSCQNCHGHCRRAFSAHLPLCDE